MGGAKLIINVDVIAKNSILKNQGLIMEDGKIKHLFPMEQIGLNAKKTSIGEVIDGEGGYLAPGFIDIHSDNLESAVQPRPNSIIDFEIALMEQEKQLANQGITTMYHSLSFIDEGSSVLREKEARKPDKMKEIVELIKNLEKTNHLIRHKFHCRFDVRNTSGYDVLMDYIEKNYLDLLSFMDHTPGQGQYKNLGRYKETMKKYKSGIDDREIDTLIKEKISIPVLSNEKIEDSANMAREKGIPIASHDDDSEEKLLYVNTKLNAVISEFPIELDVARKAKKRGMLTVAGAPNVLLGRSHSGNVSATEAILDGCIDILCSDYYPPAMLHAVFKLNRNYKIPLWESMKLVTVNPAKALGIEKDYGTIENGKKADLVLIHIINEKPAITKVFIDGHLVSDLNYRNLNYDSKNLGLRGSVAIV
ncbi:alpha-D-ribose 1-methylphosphonate 5-triphosphate diphosphatase [Herbivorax sp. ANBcel31]|uniref:alpha-D-ribose 1-methylphosphonate 5-triphosphate diphosphatase n=1 Tax=Herbivorax sp. ANBcel31 TaxID=3069754 RepID=UPI0027B25389|nr:alpha-D-ribose 1-methylphosphonate 5-triphosphate diphosphatase [Herbivorax sp. ANBcel31]MDQ2086741.1 alpha-D-ribose 1-methylphosphonate 5-triphosphate diphosphatase [Herbivorax sp. ANBcel31]